jgi:hypothetical protein
VLASVGKLEAPISLIRPRRLKSWHSRGRGA